jgi:hypothetical protein
LLKGDTLFSADATFGIEELAEKIALGGWPGLIGASATDGLRFVRGYVILIAAVDLSRVFDRRRDAHKVMRLLQYFVDPSLAAGRWASPLVTCCPI